MLIPKKTNEDIVSELQELKKIFSEFLPAKGGIDRVDILGILMKITELVRDLVLAEAEKSKESIEWTRRIFYIILVFGVIFLFVNIAKA